MDNAQKAIMIGVGLFITIIIIAAIMLITGAGQDLMNQGTQQIGNISESLRIQVTDQYDGKVLTGSQVKIACSELIGKEGVIVQINSSGPTSDKDYTPTPGTITLESKTVNYYKSYNDVKHAITSTTKKYTGEVKYYANEGIALVNFK